MAPADNAGTLTAIAGQTADTPSRNRLSKQPFGGRGNAGAGSPGSQWHVRFVGAGRRLCEAEQQHVLPSAAMSQQPQHDTFVRLLPALTTATPSSQKRNGAEAAGNAVTKAAKMAGHQTIGRRVCMAAKTREGTCYSHCEAVGGDVKFVPASPTCV